MHRKAIVYRIILKTPAGILSFLGDIQTLGQMKKPTLLFFVVALFAVSMMSSCIPSPAPALTPSALTPALTPTPQGEMSVVHTSVPPTQTPPGEITVVPSTSVGGSGIPFEGPDVILQEGNSHPRFQLLTRPSVELADNRIGLAFAGAGLVWELENLPNVLEHLTYNGAKHLHSSMYEIEPPIDWSSDEYHVPPEFDLFVDDLNNNGVFFNYVLNFWDKDGHASGEELSTPRFKTEEQIQDFLDYIRFVVAHFKGRVQYYTIWNEPDNCGGSGINCIRPKDYIDLVRRTVPVIRQEDPQAKVAIAPNVLFFGRENFFAVLESDVMPLFDVIQWHGLYDVLPNDTFYGNYYYEYPTIIDDIKQTAAANGFSGEYWSTEITWCSESFPNCKPDDQPWGQAETDRQAAKYYARGIVMHLGVDVGISLGGFQTSARWSLPAIRNLNTVMAGAVPTSLTANVESEVTNILSYAFTLPNGDRLYALWTNGEAADSDPGMITTLTFPGLSVQQVEVIDILNGSEQELITEMENEDLVLRNLLIKDYPIFIRLIN